MTRRILIALPIALVVGLAFSVQSAMGVKVGDPAAYRSTPIVSEKTAGLGQISQPAASRVVSSEVSTGLVRPFSHSSQPVVASTDEGFNWSDAGIGAAALFGTMLLGAAGALTLRRHRGTVAH
jgi:hypothetical protein